MDRAPVLRARDLRVERPSRSGGFELVVDSLDLFGGEAIAILGANGAGKTTLLMALAGLMELRSGTSSSSQGSGQVTMVFQHALAFAGTVEHNLRVGLLGRGLDRSDEDARVESALEGLGIVHLRSRSAKRLSGGELRRLALARAMVLRPTVLLLDEPFDDLDPSGQELLSRDLLRLVKDTGIALALVTHDLRRAALVASRLAVLGGGRLLQVGKVVEVLSHPVDRDVAALVGMINILPGVIVRGEGGVAVEIEGGGRLQVATDLPQGSAVSVGFRPERLKLEPEQGALASSIGEAHVVGLTTDSILTRVTLEWMGRELFTHLLYGRGRQLAIGDRVALSIQSRDLHLMGIPKKVSPSI